MQREKTPRRDYPEGEYPEQELTREIIGAFYYVHHRFGFGFLESVYRNALAIELRHRGIPVRQEVTFVLRHRERRVGIYRADLIAGALVIVEAKSGLSLDPAVLAQLLNYLAASKLRIGLVLHFGPRPTVKRLISSRQRLEDISSACITISETERRSALADAPVEFRRLSRLEALVQSTTGVCDRLLRLRSPLFEVVIK